MGDNYNRGDRERYSRGGRGYDRGGNYSRGGSGRGYGNEGGSGQRYSNDRDRDYGRSSDRGGGSGRHGHFDRGRGSDRYGSGRDSDRGRGDYRGQGDRDHHNIGEKLECENMFETVNKENMNPSDNQVIPECGEKYGNFGDPISLSSNYVRVCSLPNCTIHQYIVTFEPELNSMKLRQALLRSRKDIIKSVCAFDGSTLYLPYKINDMEVLEKTTRGDDVKINIKYTNSVPVGSPSSACVFNIIIRRIMKLLEMKQIKRHHFDPKEAKRIENIGLEVWPGISGSLSFFNNLPMYCVDISHHVMRSVSVHDFVASKVQSSSNVSKEDLEKSLVGQIVMTRYNNRTYRIDSMDWSRTPSSTFELKGGEKISYVDYYTKHYGITITDMEQPLIVSIMKERRAKHEDKMAKIKGETRQPTENIIHLIPELCFLTGVTDDIRSNFSIMKELSVYTRLNPTKRCNGVYSFLKRIDSCQPAAEYLNNWGVEFNKQLLTIPARQYPAEKIFFKNIDQPFTYNIKDADWTAGFRNSKLMNPGCINKWVVFCTRRDVDCTYSFLDTLIHSCSELGFNVSKPEVIEIPSANASELCRAMKVLDKTKYDMVFFVLPPNRKELYDSAKTICCLDRPVPSQVILTKTLNRQNALKSVATKVAIQMSAKMGGEPWCVHIPSKFKMVVGIDVCHDNSNSKNSWLGFVASLNDNFTRYYSRACRQPTRTEIADSLGVNMKMALEHYHKLNNRMPDSVIVYRDGVGDGQLEVVRVHEIPSVRACLQDVCKAYGCVPSLAYVIVRKRISTRLFSPSTSCATNPMPGSIVDRVVTKDDYPNFFLVSQSVREGTVNPTHYIVVGNDTKLSTNNVQRLSYKLCHLYFNWSGTVRVPAPCQYAHKLCFLVSQNIGKEPSPVLSDRLYYL